MRREAHPLTGQSSWKRGSPSLCGLWVRSPESYRTRSGDVRTLPLRPCPITLASMGSRQRSLGRFVCDQSIRQGEAPGRRVGSSETEEPMSGYDIAEAGSGSRSSSEKASSQRQSTFWSRRLEIRRLSISARIGRCPWCLSGTPELYRREGRHSDEVTILNRWKAGSSSPNASIDTRIEEATRRMEFQPPLQYRSHARIAGSCLIPHPRHHATAPNVERS